MGAEYKFNLTDRDFAAFESDVRGKTLDNVLRGVPGFDETDGSVYSYRTGDPENKWRTTVSVHQDYLLVCDYGLARGDNDYLDILHYLMWELLDVCGRVSIEDA